jgi:hypothetical protein
MAYKTADRVKEDLLNKPNTTGSFTLSGTAQDGYKKLADVLTNGDTFPYCAVEKNPGTGALWEVGTGTFVDSTSDTVTRATTVFSNSSGTTSRIDFSAATNDLEIFITLPSDSIFSNPVTSNVNWGDYLIQRPYFKDYSEATSNVSSSSGTLTLDLENGNIFNVTVNENITTLTVSNPPSTGRAGGFLLILNFTSSYSISWPASFSFPNSSYPALSTSGVDILSFLTVNAGSTWYGVVVGQSFG